ncbi:MAG: helical backbone metal receptor, partial [Chitinophagaceae bacterium]
LINEFPVWISDVNDLSDACRMMESVGILTNRTETAGELNEQVRKAFGTLPPVVINNPDAPGRALAASNVTAAYLIWKDPYMTTGGDTFISDMMNRAGFKNLFANRSRYPVTTIEELQALQCKLVLLSSEPYPFKQAHAEYLQKQLPGTQVLLVDGEAFSWYGSRLLEAPSYFHSLHNKLEAMCYIR